MPDPITSLVPSAVAAGSDTRVSLATPPPSGGFETLPHQADDRFTISLGTAPPDMLTQLARTPPE